MRLAQGQVRRLIEKYPAFYPFTPMKAAEARQARMDPLVRRIFARDDVAVPGERTDRRPRVLARRRRKYSHALEHRKEDREVHDLGFIFYHGAFKRWYDATVREGNPTKTPRCRHPRRPGAGDAVSGRR